MTIINLFKKINRSTLFSCLLSLSLLILLPINGHADDSQTFTFTNESSSHFFDPAANDQSLIYLGEIFGTMPSILAGSGSTLLSDIFGIFNTIVMVVAIFFVAYTTFVGILNTAGDGEMFGRKWSSMWVPVRLVGGLGLLVPTDSGYCVAQMIIMWIVVQGIGAADHLTNTVIDYMEQGQVVFMRSIEDASGGDQGQTGGATGSEAETNSITTYDSTISALYQGMTCMQAIYKTELALSNEDPTLTPPTPVSPPQLVANSDKTVYTMTFPATSAEGDTSTTCGQIVIDHNTADLTKFQTFMPYLQTGINAIMPSINAAAYYMVNYNPYLYDDDPDNDTTAFHPPKPNDTTDSPENLIEEDVLQASYDFVGSNYMEELSQTYNSYAVQGQNAIIDDTSHYDYYEDIRAYGWVALGDIYWYMVQSVRQETLSEIAILCQSSTGSTTTDMLGVEHTCTFPTEGFFDVSSVKVYTLDYAPTFINSLIQARDNGNVDTSDFVVSSGASYNPIDAMVKAINGAIMSGLSDPTQNPIVSAQNIGHTIIIVVEVFFAVITIGAVTIGAIAGYMASISPGFLIAQSAMAMILPGFFLFATTFLVLGATLSVLMPIIPAIIFFLAVIHWMVSVTEAVVAGPIIATGILHPEGSELWGKAEPAVMLMVNMFLRPSLIVVGLSAGVILSFVTTGFINFAFFNAMNLTTANNEDMGGTTAIESVMFLFTYVGLIMLAINKSFGTIHLIPDMVLRWISGGERASFGRGGAEDMQKVSEQQGKGESANKEHGQELSKDAQSGQKRGEKAGKDAKKQHGNDKSPEGSNNVGEGGDGASAAAATGA